MLNVIVHVVCEHYLGQNGSVLSMAISIHSRYTEEEFFEEFEESDTSSEEDSTSDEEWGRTPMGRRIKSARKSLAVKINEPKRKRKNEVDGATEGDETEDDGNTGKPSKKKSSITGGKFDIK